MATGSQNMTTFNAKRIIGDSTNVNWAGALLHSGRDGKTSSMDTWIFADDYGSASSTYGILHRQNDDKIVFVGASADRFWNNLNTGDTYIGDKLGIGYNPETSGNTYKLYVNGTSYLNGELSVIGTILEKNGSICIDNTTTDLTASNNGSSSTIYHSIWGRDKANRSWFCVEGYTNANGSVAAYLGVRNYNTSGTAQSWKGITITEAKDNTLTYTVSDPSKFITAIMGDSDSSKFYRGDKTWSNTITGPFNASSSGTARANINMVTVADQPNDFYLGNNNANKWSITSRASNESYNLNVYSTASGIGYCTRWEYSTGKFLMLHGAEVSGGYLVISQPDDHRDYGLYGTYKYTKAATIWSMGTAYKIAADGSGLGNLYGAAYGYGGQAYLGSKALAGGHQFIWCDNGNPLVALGSNGLWIKKAGGIYWDSYVESASDASDVSRIIQIASGCAGGTELQIYQANDATDCINLVTPKSIYLNSKEAFNVNDSWLRINENKKFTSGVYFGSSLVRTDGTLRAGTGSGSWTDITAGAVVSRIDSGEARLEARNGTHRVYLYCNSDGRAGLYGVRTDGTAHSLIAFSNNSSTGTFYGNCTGSSASCTGNAATATKLATKRTISLTGSVTGSGSFDGSGDLSIATTTNHSHTYIATHASLAKGSKPSSTIWLLGSWGYETGSGTAVKNRFCGFEGSVDTNGRSNMSLIAYQNTAGSTAANSITVWMDQNGTRGYSVSDAAAFRSAIGAGTSSLTIGTTATTAAAGNHTHTISSVSWPGGQNLTCTPTAANQEYSIDLGNAYTGTYWHVWSAKNSKSILVCYNDNMNVSVPNGTLTAHAFSGPLTGDVTGNCSGSAGSVAWSGVSSKPATATRWPSWSEVTSKPAVQNNLTSTSTTDMLSAAQGRALNNNKTEKGTGLAYTTLLNQTYAGTSYKTITVSNISSYNALHFACYFPSWWRGSMLIPISEFKSHGVTIFFMINGSTPEYANFKYISDTSIQISTDYGHSLVFRIWGAKTS